MLQLVRERGTSTCQISRGICPYIIMYDTCMYGPSEVPTLVQAGLYVCKQTHLLALDQVLHLPPVTSPTQAVKDFQHGYLHVGDG